MAGLGAAINTGAVTRDDTVAVIGCGGVGDAAIAGAALVGARRIIAVDTDDTKLDWARGFAPPTPSTPARPTWWPRFRTSPTGSAPTW